MLISTHPLEIYRTVKLNKDLFLKEIARLEAAKNETWSPLTINVWYDEMVKRGWTDEFFRERCKAVMEAKIFGKVSFDTFVDSPALYTKAEALQMAHSIIKRRADEWIDLKRGTKWSTEELAEAGLYELTGLKYAKRAEEREKIFEKLIPFIKSLLDDEGRLKQ